MEPSGRPHDDSGRISRERAARILARAHELAGDDGVADATGLEPEALVEAAAEVGIDPDAVRDALAVERFSVEAEAPARLDRVAGPATVVVERVVALSVGELLDRVDSWLTVGHRLRTDRRGDVLVASKRSDTAASVGRTLAGLVGEGRLGDVRRLRVEAVPQRTGASAGSARARVRIAADRAADRTTRLGGGSVLGAAGVGTAVVGLAEAIAWWPVAAVPLAVGGGVLAASGGRRAERLELELERLLSAVERDERPATLLGRFARRWGPGRRR